MASSLSIHDNRSVVAVPRFSDFLQKPINSAL
jgi:hypothetical protein